MLRVVLISLLIVACRGGSEYIDHVQDSLPEGGRVIYAARNSGPQQHYNPVRIIEIRGTCILESWNGVRWMFEEQGPCTQ